MRFVLAVLLSTLIASAASEDDIRKILNDQQTAWNKGDIETFMTGYLNSPDITFMGKEISRGYGSVLDRYRKTYGDRAKMGTLQFSELEVKMLGKDAALILGKFHLTRTAEGGGDASGRFTLIAQKTAQGWKVIHDHTS